MKARLNIIALAACLAAAPAMADELVVIVNPQNPATRMFPGQAAQFFLGKSAMFTPLDLPENSPLRAQFYQKVTGKDADEVAAIRARLVFTGKAVAPRVVRTSADMKKAVAADPNAIGYIEKSALDGSVKAILAVP